MINEEVTHNLLQLWSGNPNYTSDLGTDGTIKVEIKLRKVHYGDSGQGPVKGYCCIIIIIRIP